MPAQDLADHRRLGMTGGGDDQHVARPDQLERMQDRTEIGRLAQGRHRAPEQARLPARRPQRADGRVDLADLAAEIDRDGDRHRAPAVDLGRREIEGRGGVERDGHPVAPSAAEAFEAARIGLAWVARELNGHRGACPSCATSALPVVTARSREFGAPPPRQRP